MDARRIGVMLSPNVESTHQANARGLVRSALGAVRAHAEVTYPEECCGLLFDDGPRRCTNAAAELHAHDPLTFPRTARHAFHLSAADQLALARSFDGNRPARVLYHSHVDAGAYLSEADVAGATMDGVPLYEGLLHLVVAVRRGVAGEAALFALDGAGSLEIERFRA